MPLKGGKLTPMERAFSEKMVATGDPVYAAEKAGYSSPHARASQNMANQAIVDDIRKKCLKQLNDGILPLAIEQHEKLLKDPLTPAGARVQAIKLAYDRTLGAGDDGSTKEPHEMTSEEIDRRLAALRAEAANRSKPVLEHEPAKASDLGVMG